MKDGKDGFLERYGGWHFPETEEQLKARIRRMDELYAKEPQTPSDTDELARLFKGNPHQP